MIEYLTQPVTLPMWLLLLLTVGTWAVLLPKALKNRAHVQSELALTPKMAREIAEELVYIAIWLERKEDKRRAGVQSVASSPAVTWQQKQG